MSGTLSDVTFVSAVADELRDGHHVALASLLATTGSMPCHEGARMAALEDGTFVGTVGGGNIELIASERAQSALAGQPYAPLQWLTRERTGMACGGDALLGVRVLGPKEAADIYEIEALLIEGGTGVLEERWATPSSPEAVFDANAVPRHLGWDEQTCTYREYISAPETLHIFGAGHVGTALVPIAASVSFTVVVYDDRPVMADPDRLPEAEQVICGPFEETAAAADVTTRDFVVVLTHGHVSDTVVLERTLPRRPAYAGCIGSRNKADVVRASLLKAGVPADQVESLHLPIGEAIGAVTPAEIAVSIAAELIRCRAELASARRLG